MQARRHAGDFHSTPIAFAPLAARGRSNRHAKTWDSHPISPQYLVAAAEFLGKRAAGGMVVMRVADENDFDVGKVKAEFFNAALNDGYGFFVVGIEQNEARRCGDQIGGQKVGADIIDVAGDAEGRQWLIPVRREIG